MLWDNIIGHQDIVHTLRQLRQTGRLPHALLFAGPAGVGKQLAARCLAADLFCDSNDRPCGECLSCRRVMEGTHPDLLIIKPDGNMIKIDQIRAVQQEAALAPAENAWRVCLVDEADRMNDQAANSILKLLEEPPAGFIWILITAKRHRILSTIQSRCRLIQFEALPAELLAASLQQRGETLERAELAARLSGGAVGSALSLLSEGGFDCRNEAAAMLFNLTGAPMSVVWKEADRLEKMDGRRLLELLKHLMYLIRDMLLFSEGMPGQAMMNVDMAAQLADQAARWDKTMLNQAGADVRNTYRVLANTNANARLTCEALLLKINDCSKGVRLCRL